MTIIEKAVDKLSADEEKAPPEKTDLLGEIEQRVSASEAVARPRPEPPYALHRAR